MYPHTPETFYCGPFQSSAGPRLLPLEGEWLPQPWWPLVTIGLAERGLRPVSALDLILAQKKDLAGQREVLGVFGGSE